MDTAFTFQYVKVDLKIASLKSIIYSPSNSTMVKYDKAYNKDWFILGIIPK